MKVNLKINGIEIAAEAGETLLHAARRYGIEIPTLCHSEKAKAYGACGICVVEGQNGGKLLRSCATEITPQMEGASFQTETPRVVQARKVALELLMTDHTGDCRPPCMLACPAQTDCQGYVGLIANGREEEALKLIMDKIPLPASIGRVCPHPCETACRRTAIEEPISIAFLKRYAADINLKKGTEAYRPAVAEDTGKCVAVIGGGPGGLTAASILRRKGHAVTVFDAMPEMGGMLRYGIPEYRLPKSVLDAEITLLRSMGIEMRPSSRIGGENGIQLSDLKKEYDAVIVAIGAWTSSKMRIPGEDLCGVLGGIDFLRKIAMGEAISIGSRVAVVGGGNTAMDACRSAVRAGACEVYVLYRRTRAEMPAAAVEIEEAEEEGVQFKFLCNPVELLGENGRVAKVRAQKMQLGQPDAGGRRSPVPIEGAYEEIPVDSVIMAIGQGPDIRGFEQLKLTRKGTIAADEATFATSEAGVYACGDVTNKGADIAVSAIGEAQKAAAAVDAFLTGLRRPCTEGREYPYYSKRELKPEEIRGAFPDLKPEARAHMAHMDAAERKQHFHEFMQGFTKEEAETEANRCLSCGCMDYFECKLIAYANQYRVDPSRFAGAKHPTRPKEYSRNFVRDTDKCILCGLCLRVCEEVAGVTALGLVGRGFQTVVQPEMGLPLDETACRQCGLCVSVCPTGALTERLPLKKQVPLAETCFDTVCNQCSAGCRLKAAVHGGLLLRALPEEGTGAHLLCRRGRFGYPAYNTLSDTVEEAKAELVKLERNGAEIRRIAVLISSSCSERQLKKIVEFARQDQRVGMMACYDGRLPLPEADREAAALVAVKNGLKPAGAPLYAGAREALPAEYGIEALSEEERRSLDSGGYDVLLTFGRPMDILDISCVKYRIQLKTEVF